MEKIKTTIQTQYIAHEKKISFLIAAFLMYVLGFLFFDILDITKQSFKKELYNIDTLTQSISNIQIHYYGLLNFAIFSLYLNIFYKKINLPIVSFTLFIAYFISIFLPNKILQPSLLIPGIFILTYLMFSKEERCRERIFVWFYSFMIIAANFTFHQAIHNGIFQNYQKRALAEFSLKNEKKFVNCLTNECISIKDGVIDQNINNPRIQSFIDQYGDEILKDYQENIDKNHSKYYISTLDGLLVGFQPEDGYTTLIFETKLIEHELLFSKLWVFYLSIFAYGFWISFCYLLYFLHSSKKFKDIFIRN